MKPLSQSRILIVDDVKTNVDILVNALKDEYKAVEALITARITSIDQLVAVVKAPNADRTTAVQTANQIVKLVDGAPGLQGAKELVRQLLVLNTKAATGG